MAAAWGKAKEGTKTSIWNIEHESVVDRIAARRERIRKRIDAAKRLTKLMKIQKMMGFKVEDDEELFVAVATARGDTSIHGMTSSGQELVSNVRLAGEFLQVEHRNAREAKNATIKAVLEKEEADMEEKFGEIGRTWPNQGDRLRGAPTQLFEEILAQKELCNQVTS